MERIKLGLAYFFIISLVASFLSLYDKVASKNYKKARISENTLLALGLMGGALAMYLTMKLVRHKTRHKKFMVGLPLIIGAQGLGLIYLYSKNLL